MKKILYGVIMMLIYTSFSCTKGTSNSNNNSNTTNDIYVVGGMFDQYDSGYASIWKNSVPSLLSTKYKSSYANSGCVSNSNIYVVGIDGGRPVVWINNKETILPTTSGFGEADKIHVSGNDVYIAGMDENRKLILWKNNVQIQAPTSYYGYNEDHVSFDVLNNDIYFVGIDTLKKPTLWKNNVPITLPTSTGKGVAFYVFVSGNDVYVLGYDKAYFSNNLLLHDTTTKYNGIIWKNSVQINTIVNSPDLVESFFIYNSDFYVIGYNGTCTCTSSYGLPAIWKNGMTPTRLPTLNMNQINSVYSDGTNIYVCGYDNSLVLWINGQRNVLTSINNLTVSYSRWGEVFGSK